MFVYAQVDGKTSMHLVFAIVHCSISFWELGSSIYIYFNLCILYGSNIPSLSISFKTAGFTLLLPKNCSILSLSNIQQLPATGLIQILPSSEGKIAASPTGPYLWPTSSYLWPIILSLNPAVSRVDRGDYQIIPFFTMFCYGIFYLYLLDGPQLSKRMTTGDRPRTASMRRWSRAKELSRERTWSKKPAHRVWKTLRQSKIGSKPTVVDIFFGIPASFARFSMGTGKTGGAHHKKAGWMGFVKSLVIYNSPLGFKLSLHLLHQSTKKYSK